MKNMKTLLATLSALTLGTTTVGNLNGILNVSTKNNMNIKDVKINPTFNRVCTTGLEHKTILTWENIGITILISAVDKDNKSALYKSIDGGNSFTEIKNTRIADVESITSLLNVDGTIYASTYNQNKGKNAASLYKSIDGGNSFTEIKNTGLGGLLIDSLLNVNGTIYAGTNDGLWKSVDGKHFDKLKTNNYMGNFSSMIVSNDGAIYAACTTSNTTGDLYKSIDGGNSFTKILTPNVHGVISTLLNVNGTIYAGTSDDDVKNKDLGDLYTMVEDKFTKLENTGIVNNGISMPVTNLLNMNGIIYVESVGKAIFKQNN